PAGHLPHEVRSMIDVVLLLIILASSADTAPRWIVWSLILITTHAIYRLLALEARREKKFLEGK
ncbi:hypothetical protein, partial [Faecalibaculum rodentium]|uniref:hypothetical protein n=1 Tax=Faecalibaculum rodentium TaxID=1702221 RepID=UPI0025A996D9